MQRLIALMVLALSPGCSAFERTEGAPEIDHTKDTAEDRDEPTASSTAPAATLEVLPAKPLPVIGDPYGLLSRRPEGPAKPTGSATADRLDPGALAVSPSQLAGSTSPAERDPRAVERANAELLPKRPQPSFDTEVHDMSAAEVSRDVNRGRGQVQVLFLYASYCQYCRSSMSPFLALSQRYQQRGVRFTAASVDRDRDAFAAYAPNLAGQFPAWRVLPETGLGHELVKLGVPLKERGLAIPLFAVLDSRQRMVSQGASVERMAQSLEELLAK